MLAKNVKGDASTELNSGPWASEPIVLPFELQVLLVARAVLKMTLPLAPSEYGCSDRLDHSQNGSSSRAQCVFFSCTFLGIFMFLA